MCSAGVAAIPQNHNLLNLPNQNNNPSQLAITKPSQGSVKLA